MGFKQSSNDHCIFVSTEYSLIIYVDDIVLAAKLQQTIAKVKAYLGEHFE